MLVLPDRDELLFEFDLANLKPQAKESPESSGRIRLAMITTIPVSYTHLDVYKRQIITL